MSARTTFGSRVLKEVSLKFQIELAARAETEEDAEDRLSDFLIWLLENKAVIRELYTDERELDPLRYEIRTDDVFR